MHGCVSYTGVFAKSMWCVVGCALVMRMCVCVSSVFGCSFCRVCSVPGRYLCVLRVLWTGVCVVG